MVGLLVLVSEGGGGAEGVLILPTRSHVSGILHYEQVDGLELSLLLWTTRSELVNDLLEYADLLDVELHLVRLLAVADVLQDLSVIFRQK